ncbi:hypothetical protein [Brevundimonas sp.]|uniref:hypothetical protein n=1 Tax=Brevundimonas sp. TaxID=1871086 RepID=UPI002D69EF94|nr:hypothetical protein [Brevundimonas sp.]HYC99573.1 hypothetical protein [Brevundimonas sp.]
MLVRPRDLPTAAEMQADKTLNRIVFMKDTQLEDRVRTENPEKAKERDRENICTIIRTAKKMSPG